jgi:hypothetical protein
MKYFGLDCYSIFKNTFYTQYNFGLILNIFRGTLPNPANFIKLPFSVKYREVRGEGEGVDKYEMVDKGNQRRGR